MSVQIERHHFTVSEYYRMSEAGIFTEDDQVELIEGEIIEMSPIGSRHAACVKRLLALLSGLKGEEVIISVQDPVWLDDHTEPQPDLALLKARDDFYASRHPIPSDVLLVVEIAETSLSYDREIKIPLYAKAGLAETWLIDLQCESVTLYTRPVEGIYRESYLFTRGESITSHTVPALSLTVDAILG